MRQQVRVFMLAAIVTLGCKSPSQGSSQLRDGTLVDNDSLPPVKYAYWADKDFVYRGYCSWSSAPFDRSTCDQQIVKLPVKEFTAYFQKLEIMPDDYEQSGKTPSAEQRKAATAELLTALQESKELTWLPMQRRVPSEYRGQIKLSDDALVLATRINQCFLGVGIARAVMPPFMVSVFELTGRGALKIGVRNGIKSKQSVIIRDGKTLREGAGFFDLYKEVPSDNGARPPTCQLFNSGDQTLPSKTILFVTGWDRQNPNHSEVTAFRLYKDPQLTQETGFMSCVGAFSESKGAPAPVFPLGELLSTFKDSSDFIVQGYME